jgi:hypothetical protein
VKKKTSVLLLIIVLIISIIYGLISFYVEKNQIVYFEEINIDKDLIGFLDDSYFDCDVILYTYENDDLNLLYYKNPMQSYQYYSAELIISDDILNIMIESNNAVNDTDVNDTLIIPFKCKRYISDFQVFLDGEPIDLKHIKDLFEGGDE